MTKFVLALFLGLVGLSGYALEGVAQQLDHTCEIAPNNICGGGVESQCGGFKACYADSGRFVCCFAPPQSQEKLKTVQPLPPEGCAYPAKGVCGPGYACGDGDSCIADGGYTWCCAQPPEGAQIIKMNP
ncbi:MAG: hypothetical protein ACPGNT_11555 [Rhodospirillales bacterium]